MATIQELVPKVARYLAETAANQGNTTYQQVASAVGTHPRVVPKVLESLRCLCIERGFPPITVLVFSKGQNGPRESCLDPWLPRDASQAERDAMFGRLTQEVHGFDWSVLLALFPEDKA